MDFYLSFFIYLFSTLCIILTFNVCCDFLRSETPKQGHSKYRSKYMHESSSIGDNIFSWARKIKVACSAKFVN